MKYVINGIWSLGQQRNSIQYFMNMNLLELVRIEAVKVLSSPDAAVSGSTTPVNLLEFKDATGPCKPLVMLTPPPAASPDGMTIIGEPTEVFVLGVKVPVACYQ